MIPNNPLIIAVDFDGTIVRMLTQKLGNQSSLLLTP